MTRMICLDGEIYNADLIVEVEETRDGRLKVLLDDGSTFVTAMENKPTIMGEDFIVSLVPCNSAVTLHYHHGRDKCLVSPVSYFAITAAGTLRPVNSDGIFMEDMPDATYHGMWPRY